MDARVTITQKPPRSATPAPAAESTGEMTTPVFVSASTSALFPPATNIATPAAISTPPATSPAISIPLSVSKVA